MIIRNEASKNTVTHLTGKPNKEDQAKYYNTTQISMMLGEMDQILGTEAVIDFLKDKINYYKVISKQQGGK